MTDDAEPAAARPTGFEPADTKPAVPAPLRVACVVLGLEAAALVGLGGFLLVDTATGGADDPSRGLFSAAFALVGAAALAAGVRGLLRLSPAARTPMVVLQLLALPAAYSMAFQNDLVALGGPIFVAALAVLYLLFTPPVRAVLDRDLDV